LTTIRYRHNLDKIKSGDIYEVADVVRDLMIRDRDKGLSTAERKMLNNAKQILISELVLSTEYDVEVGCIKNILAPFINPDSFGNTLAQWTM
jgi:RNA polymerase-interacting CarD/CdnL/TRCF family regulator